ncbi:MAG: 4Fe-4S binding protein [Pirellulaceae bacterium]
MASGEPLQERRATRRDGSIVHYFTAPSGEIFFGTNTLCSDIYGYGGPIGLALRVQQDGTLRDLRVVRSNETPIYLANLRRGWLSTLPGRNIFEPAPFSDVDAVSGSTVTSRAVLRTLERSGLRFAAEILGRNVRQTDRWKQAWVPDREFVCLAVLSIVALGLRQWPGTWRRRGILLASLLLTGVLFNVQYSTQQVFALLSLQVHGSGLSGSFFLVICVPLLVVLFGNVYCGYVCPFGALQELLGDLPFARWASDPDKRVWRYGRMVKYLLLLLVALLFAVTRDFAVLSADPLISLFGAMRGWPVVSLAGIVLILSFVFRRFWCRNLCPAGAFLSLLGGFRPFRTLSPATRPTKCDLGVRVASELDCLCCDRCRHEKD